LRIKVFLVFRVIPIQIFKIFKRAKASVNEVTTCPMIGVNDMDIPLVLLENPKSQIREIPNPNSAIRNPQSVDALLPRGGSDIVKRGLAPLPLSVVFCTAADDGEMERRSARATGRLGDWETWRFGNGESERARE
jgi:hypothetical protein